MRASIDIRAALRLYAITPCNVTRDEAALVPAMVEDAIKGGATMLQLRAKGEARDALLANARAIASICRRYNVPFIVDDDPYLALELGAVGVHLGPNDMGIAQARSILGKDAIIGSSARGLEAAISREEEGATYIGAGAVFPTLSKGDAKPLPLETLRDICKGVSIPVVAIGGINITNIQRLEGLPIAGVAVIGGIFGGAPSGITERAKRLSMALGELVP